MKVYQNLWNTAKSMLTGKFIMLNARIKKKEYLRTSNLDFNLNNVEKGEQIKPKISISLEIIKIRVEITEMGSRKQRKSM